MTKHDDGCALVDELLASLREAMDILDGKIPATRFHAAPTPVDVRAIRQRLKLSQTAFAHRFGFSVGTVRGLEQGTRRPDPATRTLLLVIATRPEVVEEVFAAGQPAAAQARPAVAAFGPAKSYRDDVGVGPSQIESARFSVVEGLSEQATQALGADTRN